MSDWGSRILRLFLSLWLPVAIFAPDLHHVHIWTSGIAEEGRLCCCWRFAKPPVAECSGIVCCGHASEGGFADGDCCRAIPTEDPPPSAGCCLSSGHPAAPDRHDAAQCAICRFSFNLPLGIHWQEHRLCETVCLGVPDGYSGILTIASPQRPITIRGPPVCKGIS